MADQSVIVDVRSAKVWVDRQATTFQELGERLLAVEQAYRTRTGDYASVPERRPEAVRQAIEAAADEPGAAILRDIRSARPG
mgnify:CR=1 FL=1